MRAMIIAAVLVVFTTPLARAQFSLGLPRLDSINVFYRAARISPSSSLKGVPTAPCNGSWRHTPACGWGFETMYDLTSDDPPDEEDVRRARRLEEARFEEVKALRDEADAMERQAESMSGADANRIRAQARAKRAQADEKELEAFDLRKQANDLAKQLGKPSRFGAELAVGYDYINIHARSRSGAKYDFLGSSQTLPSITFYGSWEISDLNSLYAGLGTGYVVLKNMRAYDEKGAIFEIGGDTWGLTASVGWNRDLIRKPKGPGLSSFAEIAYELRQFPSLSYKLPPDTKVLPNDLPRSLSASGVVYNVGFSIHLPKSDKK